MPGRGPGREVVVQFTDGGPAQVEAPGRNLRELPPPEAAADGRAGRVEPLGESASLAIEVAGDLGRAEPHRSIGQKSGTEQHSGPDPQRPGEHREPARIEELAAGALEHPTDPGPVQPDLTLGPESAVQQDAVVDVDAD